jgi:hypothetical protein
MRLVVKNNKWQLANDIANQSFIDKVAGSLPERLALRQLVPLLRWFSPSSTYYHFCIIYK